MNTVIIFALTALDSTGANGQVFAVSQPVEIGANNTAQLDLTTIVKTASTLDVQASVSNDLTNWSDLGSATNIDQIGFKMLSPDETVTSRYIRYHMSLTGTGKAIFTGTLHLSQQG